MKKLLALLMAALMLTGAALAEEDDWYLDTAEELAACVGELAGDEAYQQLMLDLEFEELDALKDVDYTAPVAAWRIEWSAVGDLLLALYSTVEAGDLSDAGQDQLQPGDSASAASTGEQRGRRQLARGLDDADVQPDVPHARGLPDVHLPAGIRRRAGRRGIQTDGRRDDHRDRPASFSGRSERGGVVAIADAIAAVLLRTGDRRA